MNITWPRPRSSHPSLHPGTEISHSARCRPSGTYVSDVQDRQILLETPCCHHQQARSWNPIVWALASRFDRFSTMVAIFSRELTLHHGSVGLRPAKRVDRGATPQIRTATLDPNPGPGRTNLQEGPKYRRRVHSLDDPEISRPWYALV